MRCKTVSYALADTIFAADPRYLQENFLKQ